MINSILYRLMMIRIESQKGMRLFQITPSSAYLSIYDAT